MSPFPRPSGGGGTITSITSNSPGGILTVTGGSGPAADIESALPTLSVFKAGGTSGALNSNAWTNIASLALTQGTWRVTAFAYCQNGGGSDRQVDFILATASAATTGAFAAASSEFAQEIPNYGNPRGSEICIGYIVVGAGGQTVYFNAYSTGNLVSWYGTLNASSLAGLCTGILAERIA